MIPRKEGGIATGLAEAGEEGEDVGGGSADGLAEVVSVLGSGAFCEDAVFAALFFGEGTGEVGFEFWRQFGCDVCFDAADDEGSNLAAEEVCGFGGFVL